MVYDNDPQHDVYIMTSAQGLEACYHVNEGTGSTIYDDSNNANHGTIYGTDWDSSPVFSNYCLGFVATNTDNVTVPDDESVRFGLTFTIELRFRLTTDVSGTIITKGNNGIRVWYNTGTNKIKIRIGDGTNYDELSTVKTFSTSTWYHLIITYDSRTVTTYVDGDYDNTAVFDYDYDDNQDNIYIGSSATPDVYFNGKLDEIRLWSIAMTSSQVTDRHDWGEAVGERIKEYCSFFNIEDTIFDNVGTGMLTLDQTVNTIITPAIGNRIEIFAEYTTASTKIFSGYIYSVNPQGKLYWCSLRDRLWQAIRRSVSGVHLDTDASEIVSDLITEYCSNIYPLHIVTSSKTVKKLKANDDKVFELVHTLADYVGDWTFYTDPYGFFYFEERGLTDSGKTIETGENVVGNFSARIVPTGLVNHLKMLGYKEYFGNTNTFAGDGSTEEFICDYEIHNSLVKIDAVQKKGGLNFNDASVDYVVRWDTGTPKIRRIIVFRSGSPPANGTTVTVEYGYPISMPLEGENSESIELYGRFDETITIPNLYDLDDAIQLFNSLLATGSVPRTVITGVKVIADTSYKSGQKVTVIDTDADLNDVLVLRKVKFMYSTSGGFRCTLDIGDKDMKLEDVLAEHSRRLRNLEHDLAGTSEITTQTKQFTNLTISIGIVTDVNIYKNTIADASIYGHHDSKYNECAYSGTTYGGYTLIT